MKKTDVYRQVADLHAKCLDKGFLATLGTRFLTLMYRAIDEAADSVLLIEEKDGRVLGFISGARTTGSIYRHMLRYPFRLSVALFPVLVRPRALIRIFDILRYGRNESHLDPSPDAELLSIAVVLDARGSGVAQALYRRLAAYFHEQGVGAFKISVGASLAAAHRFYSKMGAKPVGTQEVHSGEASVVYLHDLAARSEPIEGFVGR
ncbi:MAG TPA: GNAT family N-acetyltransferase [Dokdonella sp.]|uniref:GNAT family N-acetyltransferase n=1 Tax=Dokdonella sp. TaxID=2291710 RepID=UPI002D7E5DE2|nr:GNAT family N-acetyltransferase [Dokdonella sp.]HET9031777.1 GNAT family N-acetyltransferase [Dokdonella sp.]